MVVRIAGIYLSQESPQVNRNWDRIAGFPWV